MNKNIITITETPKEPFRFTKAGEYMVFIHNISGEYTISLEVPDTKVYIIGLFTGKNADSYTIHTVQHHKAPRSYSDLFIKGVFDDNSRFAYSGLIRIEKEGQQSHAYQKNQNLILSKGVYVESNPFLEILANDVFCTHGSTTGRLNKEDIFYAKSRGFSEKSAKELLVAGFIQEVYDRMEEMVPSTSLRNR